MTRYYMAISNMCGSPYVESIESDDGGWVLHADVESELTRLRAALADAEAERDRFRAIIEQNAAKVDAFDHAVAFDHVRHLPDENKRLREALGKIDFMPLPVDEADSHRVILSIKYIARAALGEKP